MIPAMTRLRSSCAVTCFLSICKTCCEAGHSQSSYKDVLHFYAPISLETRIRQDQKVLEGWRHYCSSSIRLSQSGLHGIRHRFPHGWRCIEDEFIARRSPMTSGYIFDTFERHAQSLGGGCRRRTGRPGPPPARQGSGRKSSTNATTFSADISHGFSKVLSDVTR